MRYFFIALLIAHQSWALTVSDPVTLGEITPLQALEQNAALSMNAQGDIVVSWKDFFSESSEDEALQVVVQEKGHWTPPSSFLVGSEIDQIFCGIDDAGAASCFWTDEQKALFARTRESGAWSDSTLLMRPTKTEKLFAFRPLNQQGKCFFLFQKGNTESSNWWDIQEHILQAIDFSPGTKLEPAQNLGSSKDLYSFGLALASDFEGNQFVFWEKAQEGRTVFGNASRLSGSSTWTEGADLEIADPRFEDVSHLQAAIGPNQEVCVIGIAEDKYSSQKSIWALEFDGQWSKPTFLFESAEEIENLQMGIDAAGNCLAVWSQRLGKKSALYSTYKPAGQAWSAALQLTPSQEIHFQPMLRADGKGNFVLTWQQLKNWKQGLIFASSFSEGAWGSPLLLSPAQSSCQLYNFALNKQGEGVAVWITGNPLGDMSLQVVKLTP